MKITLYVWKQKNSETEGKLQRYEVDDVSEHMSFLEMLDVLNERLVEQGKETIAFSHDCREGICGSCSMMINGRAHGPQHLTTACQLHMRSFNDGASIYVEHWRAKAFPVVKDLVVDRSSFDRIIQAGGYISVSTGVITDANATPVNKEVADQAMDAAACIGCGACVASCPNGSAMLFTAAKVAHLNMLPQGKIEKDERTLNMVNAMDEERFGSCTNYGECQDACPKGISINFIGKLNKDYIKASLLKDKNPRDRIKSQ